MGVGTKLLLSRLLTRSGDQAWDFATPLVLLGVFPEELKFAFFYFLFIRLGSVVLMPWIGRQLDLLTRQQGLRLGLGSQWFGVVCSSLCIYSLLHVQTAHTSFIYALLLVAGLLSALGASIMDIAVSGDLAPRVLPEGQLTQFNARLRQLDLLTEVLSPFAVGFILLSSSPQIRELGFFIVALWNLFSFIPEYLLLSQVIHSDPTFNQRAPVALSTKLSLWHKLTAGWSQFRQERVSLVIVSYALLWLSVLSPHGVLLTAFLKGGWQVSPTLIGGFRGAGAVFGLVATLVFPLLNKRFGLVKSAQWLISFQALLVGVALVCFMEGSEPAKLLFLGAILLSRIGLYGFSLAEVELRQRLIPPEKRGSINGVGSALNSLATLVIFSLGFIFSSPAQFTQLVFISVAAVVSGAVVFSLSCKRID